MNGVYIAASGAAAQLDQLNTASNNLANMDVPGYRRFISVMESAQGNGSPYEFSSSAPSQIDMSQGPLQTTGNPLDVAITGNAFLAVQTPDGTAYTRNGSLQLGSDGTLMAAGMPVLGDGGSTIVLQPGNLNVGSDGSLSVNGAPAGKLSLVDPTGENMMPSGASLYRPASGAALPPSTTSQLHQGMLEHSAGSEIGEMVSMMDVMRNYESAMNAAHSIDSNQNQAISAFTLQA
jgi:flagellar basal-body rod protein FlgF